MHMIMKIILQLLINNWFSNFLLGNTPEFAKQRVNFLHAYFFYYLLDYYLIIFWLVKKINLHADRVQ